MKCLQTKIKTYSFLILLLLSLSLLSSCSNFRGDTLKIGVVADHEPWESQLEDGNASGISVDLATQFAAKYSYQIEWQWFERDELFTALKNHKVDLILSSTTIMDDHLNELLISDPYAKVYDILLIDKNSKLIGKNEINGDHTKMAVIENSETEALIKGNYSSASITSFKNRTSAAKAVSSGICDAFADDPLSVMSLYMLNPEAYRINPAPLSDEFQYYVAYFNKGDQDLREQFNKFLFDIKKTDFYLELNEKYKLPLKDVMELFSVDFML